MKADDARPVEIYDTTLRDGAQAEDVSFSAEDKVMVAQKLDELGAHFIEGGWPGANPKDIDFFRMIKTVPLKQAKVVAFGSTRRATNSALADPTLKAILDADAREVRVPLGIHAHNDAEMAVANSLIAIQEGVLQVQGTINGIGERCGNANLSSIIPNLHFKMKMPTVTPDQLRNLREASHFVAEIANLVPDKHQPYVGDSAFAHKGGVHIDAVRKNPMTYEHIRPEAVGNRQRM